MSEVRNWGLRSLDDLAVIGSGAAPTAAKGLVPVMGANGPIGTTQRANFSGGYLIGRVGAAGAVNYVRGNCWASDNTLTVKPRAAVCDESFLGHLLQFLQPERLATKNAQPLVTQTNLGRLQANVPLDVGEQRRIAKILDTLDEAIFKTEQSITKLQEIALGLIRDLFTRGIAENEELLAPEKLPDEIGHPVLGEVPRGWRVRPLSAWVRDDSPITYGIVQAGPHVPDGVPYIRTGDMTGRRLHLDGLPRTSPNIANAYKRSKVRTGEIVCAIRATVGKVLIVPAELDGANLTQGTARISPGPDVMGRFLLWAMRSELVQRQIRILQKGTTFQEITLHQLRDVVVACPISMRAQEIIVEILDSWENRLSSEESQLEKLGALKMGLREDLLTGRVPVPTSEVTP